MEAGDDTLFCPAINSTMLKPFCQRINRCRMSIVDKGDVTMEMIGKAHSGNTDTGSAEVTKELIYISSDGMKIQVYQNSEGVHCFNSIPLSGLYKEYVYPHLPARVWKKYSHAYKFVDVVKSKTPKIVLLTDKARCKLMENVPVPDFEVHFHDGVRILLSKGKIHITEEKGGTMMLDAGCLRDRVEEKTMQMVEYTLQCQEECHHIQESLIAIQSRDNLINVFPVTIGTIHNPFCISPQTSCPHGNCDQISSQGSSDLNCNFENAAEHESYGLQNVIEQPSCAYTSNSLQYRAEFNSGEGQQTYSQWPSQETVQFHNVRSDCSFDVTGNVKNDEVGKISQNTGIVSQELLKAQMTELNMSNQSDSLVPFSIPCQDEITTHHPPGLSGTYFRTPTKCQTMNDAAQKQFYSEGCLRGKSQTKDCFHHMKSVLQNPSATRNVCTENGFEVSKTPMASSDHTQSTQQEFQGAMCPDLLDASCMGESPKKTRKRPENTPIDSKSTYPQIPSLQQHNEFSNITSLNTENNNQQLFIDSGVYSNTNEFNEITDKLEHCHILSETPLTPCSTDYGKDLGNSALFNSLSLNGCSVQCSTTESNQEFSHSRNMLLLPQQSLSPKKLSRKVAASSDSSINSKFDSYDFTTIDGNHQENAKDSCFPDNHGVQESLYEHSFGSDLSNIDKQNTSFPSSFSARRGLHLKHQEKFNTTLPHCVSPSHSRMMPTFPLSPQKEFLQGGRESMDSTLPPQVRNSLDMSISSYYSDSPSSSPSSSCDPIYQVFVPYIGWASYYAGGAIWVLYNDGTQLGVKATEAVMTFIDQDGTQKKYKNCDVVPEIVKMKLEKLPNVLKTVMKNKNYGNTS